MALIGKPQLNLASSESRCRGGECRSLSLELWTLCRGAQVVQHITFKLPENYRYLQDSMQVIGPATADCTALHCAGTCRPSPPALSDSSTQQTMGPLDDAAQNSE